MQPNEINETTKLSDEQIDQLANTLEQNRSEEDQLIMDIINNEINPNSELESEIVDMTVDQDTGELKVLNPDKDPFKTADIPVTEIEDFENKELTEEDVKDASKSYNLSDEETQKLFELILKYKSSTEPFNVYEEFPETIKKQVDDIVKEAGENGNNISKAAISRFILDEFIKEAELNRQFVDFQEAIEKELQIPSISDMYSEHIKDVMEVKLIESADKLQDEYPDRAKALRDISLMFTESYTFGLMKSTLVNNKKARNHIRESVKDYNKYCNAFNRRNQTIIVKINDIFMVAKTLSRVLPDIQLDDIKKFVVLFCKTCEQLDVNNTVHCSYMYYTIRNILALDHANEAMTDFSKNLINNIIDTIDYINETQAQIEASMPPKLLKAKLKKCARG